MLRNISPSGAMFQGESERLIRRIFRLARAAAPTVLLLDEIDGLGQRVTVVWAPVVPMQAGGACCCLNSWFS